MLLNTRKQPKIDGKSVMKSGLLDKEIAAMAQRPMKRLDVVRSNTVSLDHRYELVFVGDSQLHTAVSGTSFPAFVNAEVGGTFRWGSKRGADSNSQQFMSKQPAIKPSSNHVLSLSAIW